MLVSMEYASSESDCPIVKGSDWMKVSINEATGCRNALKAMSTKIKYFTMVNQDATIHLDSNDGNML